VAVSLTLLLGQINNGALLHPYIWCMQGYFLGLAIVVHYVVSYGLENQKDSAYLFYMGGMFLRLFLSLGLLVMYLLLATPERNAIVIGTANFLFLYLLYALVEIKSFLSNLRRNS
jgi:hypothetical protein